MVNSKACDKSSRTRKRVQKSFLKPSMTDQSHKTTCDINHILHKYRQTGLLTHVSRYNGDYRDLTTLPSDYHSALNQVLSAQESFNSLPSNIRLRFSNDPGEFLSFVSDPANLDEMVNLGLAKLPTKPVVAEAAKNVADSPLGE